MRKTVPYQYLKSECRYLLCKNCKTFVKTTRLRPNSVKILVKFWLFLNLGRNNFFCLRRYVKSGITELLGCSPATKCKKNIWNRIRNKEVISHFRFFTKWQTVGNVGTGSWLKNFSHDSSRSAIHLWNLVVIRWGVLAVDWAVEKKKE